jgi:lipopolysaccharide transport system ATP-binding protein
MKNIDNTSTKAIEIINVGKMYELFSSPLRRLLNAFSLDKLLFFENHKRRQLFWALRGITLNISKGSRVGIIGNNGAGKSTLLKIITGNVSPTEGTVQIDGRIQALMELGTGFHPEFTGRQNIYASLAYQGISKEKILELEQDIIDFSELEKFIDQPVKTYSAGMYARLAFSTATSIAPDILIIDEILGVGDAYFLNRCTERMKRLTESGTTLILVSHSMSQVLQFCDRAIWIDRGKIVKDDSCMEVVKAYERYNRVIENRRLVAKNKKSSTSLQKTHELDSFSDSFLIRLGSKDSTHPIKLRSIKLLENGELFDEILVGEPQDSNYMGHSSYLIMNPNSWSPPQQEDRISFRYILSEGSCEEIFGSAIFHLYLYEPETSYELALCYTYTGDNAISLEVFNGEDYCHIANIPKSAHEWENIQVKIPVLRQAEEIDKLKNSWPGTGELKISKVSIFSDDSKELAIFHVGQSLYVKMTIECQKSGSYPITFCVVIYRSDGIRISCHLSQEKTFDLLNKQTIETCLSFASINLGDGTYNLSLAIYKTIDRQLIQVSEYYDLISWSYEFKVIGNDPIDSSIFNHPNSWIFDSLPVDIKHEYS